MYKESIRILITLYYPKTKNMKFSFKNWFEANIHKHLG